LASTDQGAACAALCSCLLECYSVPFSAGVLVEMTKSAGAPEDTTPSLQQWRVLINSCAGIFAASNFGISVDRVCDAVAGRGIEVRVEKFEDKTQRTRNSKDTDRNAPE
jgi:hypothetical protein